MRRSRGSLNSAADVSMNTTRGNATIDTTAIMTEFSLSPHSLVKKLGSMADDISGGKLQDIELMDFDKKTAEDVDDYLRKREEIRELLKEEPENFDENGRTQLNFSNAAIAGAKLLVDETRATRSMCKKLHSECGIDEQDILYRGLGVGGRERTSVMDVVEHRKSSVIESFVDFQKQIQFKRHVLEGVIAQRNDVIAKSEASRRLTRKQQQEVEELEKQQDRKRKACGAGRKAQKGTKLTDAELLRTPSNKREVNPLDCQKIIENYALEVASEIKTDNRKRRRIAPIPFNIDLCDSDEEV